MPNARGHVYLVDDNPDIRASLGELLRQLGYAVDAYEDAEAFLTRSIDWSPAVVVLDMRMPGITGLQAQARLRALGRHTPVVFISGDSRSQEIVDAMKGGAVDFLCKPFSSEQLVAALDRALALDCQLRERRDRLSKLRQCYLELSPRERAVFGLLLEGHANKAIGEITAVQAGTVKKHRAAVLEKMGVATTADLMRECRGLEQQIQQDEG